MTGSVLAEIGPTWAWLIGGLVLAACELLAPGVFLIWLGLAAIATAGAALLVPAWQAQILVFALLAVVAVMIGRRVTRNPPSTLNRRGHDLIGEIVVLEEPIVNGAGRLRKGDTSWRVVGPDLAAGSRVRIAALDGTTLVVTTA